MSAWVVFAVASGAGLALVFGLVAWLNRGEPPTEDEIDRQVGIW